MLDAGDEVAVGFVDTQLYYGRVLVVLYELVAIANVARLLSFPLCFLYAVYVDPPLIQRAASSRPLPLNVPMMIDARWMRCFRFIEWHLKANVVASFSLYPEYGGEALRLRGTKRIRSYFH